MLAAMSPSGSLHAFDMDPVLSADVYSQFINMEPRHVGKQKVFEVHSPNE